MSEGQALILVSIIMMVAFIVLAVIEQYLELKKLKKKRKNMLIKRKWLQCAVKCELI